MYLCHRAITLHLYVERNSMSPSCLLLNIVKFVQLSPVSVPFIFFPCNTFEYFMMGSYSTMYLFIVIFWDFEPVMVLYFWDIGHCLYTFV